MARASQLVEVFDDQRVVLRMASPETDTLLSTIFRRYPAEEWASFARFGWHETPQGLILTLTAIDPPTEGELDEQAAHVVIYEPYTLRVALAADDHPLAIGVIHSHPEGYRPTASVIDDDMDGYYAPYFADFAPGRPYVSLIFAKHASQLVMSGRVWWQDRWHAITLCAIERTPVMCWIGGRMPAASPPPTPRVARLSAAFGSESAARLSRATVAVIGAGGTGSAAIETLARAGVGRLVIVDPDQLEDSNLERVHGSMPSQVADNFKKVCVARDHVRAIAPGCEVVAIVGMLPQSSILDEVLAADLVLGCTDQHASRVALSDIALRYLVPALDCGVALEGADGIVTGQIVQFVRFLAADGCAWCRQIVDPVRLAQELTSPTERTRRREAAAEALERQQDGDAYWREERQLNTVGYLTTMAGAMVAGYAIGWITGRFDVPFSRLQMNLVAPWLDVVDADLPAREDCSCRSIRGFADQGAADALISAPTHWIAPTRLED